MIHSIGAIDPMSMKSYQVKESDTMFKGEIVTRLEKLEEEVMGLQKVAHVLVERMGYVMGPQHYVDDAKDQAREVTQSPMADRLLPVELAIKAVRLQLVDATSRIQL